MYLKLKQPYFVALDLDDPEKILNIANNLKDHVGGFKLGPRLLLRYGQEFSLKIAGLAPLFIDHKFYDIPNTMLSSVKAAFDLGASFTTVHAACGPEALAELAKLEQELNKIKPFKILAVTVLTSFSENNKPIHWQETSIEQTIINLVQQAVDAGITGLVCSPYEAKILKEKFPETYIVTPGVRLAGGDVGDQKRVMTPDKALSMGASALVIGRPIVKAGDPLAVVQEINQLCTK